MKPLEPKKRYILVVDSNVNERFYTCMLLQQFGYNVFTAHTVEEAINFMTVEPPSAILADADLNGSAIFSWISKDPRFYDIPLIILSWWPHADLQDRARKGGFEAYLRKPGNVEEFYQIVQAAVEKSPRTNIRITTNLPVKLEDEFGSYEGCATALSEHGMFFRTLEPRPIDSCMRASIQIDDLLIRPEVIVLYSLFFEDGPFKEPGMGLKFTRISREDRNHISRFIQNHVEKRFTWQPLARS